MPRFCLWSLRAVCSHLGQLCTIPMFNSVDMIRYLACWNIVEFIMLIYFFVIFLIHILLILQAMKAAMVVGWIKHLTILRLTTALTLKHLILIKLRFVDCNEIIICNMRERFYPWRRIMVLNKQCHGFVELISTIWVLILLICNWWPSTPSVPY